MFNLAIHPMITFKGFFSMDNVCLSGNMCAPPGTMYIPRRQSMPTRDHVCPSGIKYSLKGQCTSPLRTMYVNQRSCMSPRNTECLPGIMHDPGTIYVLTGPVYISQGPYICHPRDHLFTPSTMYIPHRYLSLKNLACSLGIMYVPQ